MFRFGTPCLGELLIQGKNRGELVVSRKGAKTQRKAVSTGDCRIHFSLMKEKLDATDFVSRRRGKAREDMQKSYIKL